MIKKIGTCVFNVENLIMTLSIWKLYFMNKTLKGLSRQFTSHIVTYCNNIKDIIIVI